MTVIRKVAVPPNDTVCELGLFSSVIDGCLTGGGLGVGTTTGSDGDGLGPCGGQAGRINQLHGVVVGPCCGGGSGDRPAYDSDNPGGSVPESIVQVNGVVSTMGNGLGP